MNESTISMTYVDFGRMWMEQPQVDLLPWHSARRHDKPRTFLHNNETISLIRRGQLKAGGGRNTEMNSGLPGKQSRIFRQA
jgi:hypothetical protein